MRRPKYTIAVGVVFGLIALAWCFHVSRQNGSSPASTVENRIQTLTKIVAQKEQKAAAAVTTYNPKNHGRIDDLTMSVAAILRQLPGVVDVQIRVNTENPTSRIVHLRDWHSVPKKLYALDLKHAHEREVSHEEIDRRHQELLLEVRAVQLEQMALLRCLMKYHGLKRIFSEGLTAEGLPDYRKRINVLRDMEKDQIPQLAKQLEDVRELQKGLKATDERYQKAKRIEDGIAWMLDQHEARLLEVGAPGRLMIAGEIEEVLPLENAVALERAKPITADGKISVDAANLSARQDAQVKAVLDRGAFGLIVLGGSHDLADSVRRLGGGTCEYLRVTTTRFKEFSE